MAKKRAIGFQIESIDGRHDIPQMFHSFEIFTSKDVDKWLKEKDTTGAWMKVPVYKGDIEEPTFSNI